MDTTENVIYLAGGCFWALEQLMQSIPGVVDAQSGYANGTCEADASYQTVCKGNTGFRETVRVEYDPEQVSLDAIGEAEVLDALRRAQPDTMSPIEAMQLLYDLKKKLPN